jgi:hypothetical protein
LLVKNELSRRESPLFPSYNYIKKGKKKGGWRDSEAHKNPLFSLIEE